MIRHDIFASVMKEMYIFTFDGYRVSPYLLYFAVWMSHDVRLCMQRAGFAIQWGVTCNAIALSCNLARSQRDF